MKDKQDYIDRTLIKLRRQYSKDEVVSALNKQLTEKDILIGQLKYEIDEMKHLLSLNDDQKEINKKARIEARKDSLYQEQLNKNKIMGDRLCNLRKDYDKILSENIKLKTQLIS